MTIPEEPEPKGKPEVIDVEFTEDPHSAPTPAPEEEKRTRAPRRCGANQAHAIVGLLEAKWADSADPWVNFNDWLQKNKMDYEVLCQQDIQDKMLAMDAKIVMEALK